MAPQRALSMLVHGPSKVGKALDVETDILTDTGWKKMSEVEVGDNVHTIDGTLTAVLAATEEMHARPCFEVTTKTGRTIIADAEHLWTVINFEGKTVTRTTAQIAHSVQRTSGGYTYRLPAGIVLQDRTDVSLLVHPYVLGAWLGDGTTVHGSLTLNAQDAPEIMERISHEAGYLCGTVRERKGSVRVTPRGLQVRLREIGVLGNKHVPAVYLEGSLQQRQDLLAGLVDTDGYAATAPNGSGQVEFSSTTRNLAESVMALAHSLGHKAKITEKRAMLDGRDVGPAWRVTWPCTRRNSPFSVWRKHVALPLNSSGTRAKRDSIVAVTPVESRPVKCIRVAHSSGIFLAGKHLVPTHNSLLAVSTPAPRLLLDVESASRFLPLKSIVWDPTDPPPPAPTKGEWDTAVVAVRTWKDATNALEWLKQGEHPFRSASVDSISELQYRYVEHAAGRDTMQIQQWGAALREVGGFVRDLRDLTMHPTKPLEAVVITAMSKEDQSGVKRPSLQGQLGSVIPYLLDICAYLYVEPDEETGEETRYLRTRRTNTIEAGERVGGRIPETLKLPVVSGTTVDEIRAKNMVFKKIIDVVFKELAPLIAAPAKITPPVVVDTASTHSTTDQ